MFGLNKLPMNAYGQFKTCNTLLYSYITYHWVYSCLQYHSITKQYKSVFHITESMAYLINRFKKQLYLFWKIHILYSKPLVLNPNNKKILALLRWGKTPIILILLWSSTSNCCCCGTYCCSCIVQLGPNLSWGFRPQLNKKIAL